MSELSERLREAHPNSQQYALGSNILLEAAQEIESLQVQLSEARAQNKAVVVPEGQAIGLPARVQGWWQNTDGDMPASLEQDIAAMLTASPDPDHFAHVRKMVAPDVSELEKAAQKLWRESYSCESDFIQAVVDAFSKQEEEEPVVQQHYPCGCVTCICEDDVQCQGCGGTSCDDFKGPSCGCTRQQEEAER